MHTLAAGNSIHNLFTVNTHLGLERKRFQNCDLLTHTLPFPPSNTHNSIAKYTFYSQPCGYKCKSTMVEKVNTKITHVYYQKTEKDQKKLSRQAH